MRDTYIAARIVKFQYLQEVESRTWHKAFASTKGELLTAEGEAMLHANRQLMWYLLRDCESMDATPLDQHGRRL